MTSSSRVIRATAALTITVVAALCAGAGVAAAVSGDPRAADAGATRTVKVQAPARVSGDPRRIAMRETFPEMAIVAAAGPARTGPSSFELFRETTETAVERLGFQLPEPGTGSGIVATLALILFFLARRTAR